MFTIRKQWYPCWNGERPLSYAIYLGDEFIGYSWSYAGAERAIKELEKLFEQTQ